MLFARLARPISPRPTAPALSADTRCVRSRRNGECCTFAEPRPQLLVIGISIFLTLSMLPHMSSHVHSIHERVSLGMSAPGPEQALHHFGEHSESVGRESWDFELQGQVLVSLSAHNVIDFNKPFLKPALDRSLGLRPRFTLRALVISALQRHGPCGGACHAHAGH